MSSIYFVVIFYLAFIADTQNFNGTKYAKLFISNQIYGSPIDINTRRAIPLPVNLVFDPDTYKKNLEVVTEEIKNDGVLLIKPKVPFEVKPTLTANFLKSKYELGDIHLFWGKTTKDDKGNIIKVSEGSEHSINSKFYPIEVRMIYVPSQTLRNSFGLYFRVIVKVHFLNVVKNKQAENEEKKVFLDDVIPVKATSIKKTKYIAYKGTLKTGNEEKIALWIVSTQPGKIDQQTFDLLYKDHAELENRKRAPIQRLYGRKLFKLN